MAGHSSDVAIPPPVYVSLLSFEKILLEAVVSADPSIEEFIHESGDPAVLAHLFRQWQPARSVQRAFLDLEDDMTDDKKREMCKLRSPSDLVPSIVTREAAYRAFLQNLGQGHSSEGRAKIFDERNQLFKMRLMEAADVPRFLKMASKNIRITDSDLEYWKLMQAMTLRFPSEMGRWVANVSLPFDFAMDEGFEIWKVVRMYVNHLMGAKDGVTLFDLWTPPSHDALGERIWEEKREEYKRSVKGVQNLLERIREPDHGADDREDWMDDVTGDGEGSEDDHTNLDDNEVIKLS